MTIAYTLPFLLIDETNGCKHACDTRFIQRVYYMAVQHRCSRGCEETSNVTHIHWRKEPRHDYA